MTLTVAVVVVTLSIVFALTTLALAVTGQLQHPLRIAGVLAAAFLLGLLLLAE